MFSAIASLTVLGALLGLGLLALMVFIVLFTLWEHHAGDAEGFIRAQQKAQAKDRGEIGKAKPQGMLHPHVISPLFFRALPVIVRRHDHGATYRISAHRRIGQPWPASP